MICEGKKKKKLIKEQFYKGVQKQREKREGREIDRERNLLVIEDEPEQNPTTILNTQTQAESESLSKH